MLRSLPAAAQPQCRDRLLSRPNWPRSLYCHRAPHLGGGNHLCTHCYCKTLPSSCISLNKISHYTWWISSSSNSSASPDSHEFILSREIKRQFIQLLALLGCRHPTLLLRLNSLFVIIYYLGCLVSLLQTAARVHFWSLNIPELV